MKVEILAEMPDGNFIKMQILKADIVPGELVQIVVAYEAMADIVRNRETKRLTDSK